MGQWWRHDIAGGIRKREKEKVVHRMGEELKIAAYALSTTGKELNLDNMYVNGRYMSVATDSKSVFNKVSHSDFQVYGVCDSEIGVDENREVGTANGATAMQMLQKLQSALGEVGKIEKDRIWDALVETNRAMKQQKNEMGVDEMGTSFAGLFLHGNRGLAVHLGDSRIYVVRGGRMLQITDDHLESSDMYRLGVISQSQAEVHKQDSRLTAYLGMDDIYDAKDEAFSKYFVFYPGDTFVLCTDGVSDAIPNEELERMVRLLKDASVDTLASMMMKAAADKSQADMTIMILRVEEAPGEAPKRGTSTIPRRENYEKKSSGVEGTKRIGGLVAGRLPKVGRKADDEEDISAEDMDEFNQTRVSGGNRQSFTPLDESYDEEEESVSLLDQLLSNPKRLAMLAGGAIVVIILLILIISAFSGGDSDESSMGSNSSVISNSSMVPNDSTESSDNSTADSMVDSSLSTNESESSALNESSTPSNEESSNNSSVNANGVTDYTVEEGDYFYSIVLYFYGSGELELMESFAAYNNMTIDDALYPGMVLKVPPIEELR